MDRATVFGSVAAMAVLVQALVVTQPASAQTTCSHSWHIITHGETGLNVRPDPLAYQGNTGLAADGIPGDDFWNQQFLFCRDPAWAPNHYAVYSNKTARYWGVTYAGSVYAGEERIQDKNQLFEIKQYDAKWWTIRWVGGFRLSTYYICPDRTPEWGNPLEARIDAPLNGNCLFSMSSSNLMD